METRCPRRVRRPSCANPKSAAEASHRGHGTADGEHRAIGIHEIRVIRGQKDRRKEDIETDLTTDGTDHTDGNRTT